MYRLIRASFKREILFCFIILTLLPLLISNSSLIEVFKTAIARDDAKKAREQLTSIESTLTETFDTFENICTSLCEDEQIINGIGEKDRWIRNRIYNKLYEQTNGLREYARFSIYDAYGACQYSTSVDATFASLPTYWSVIKVSKAHVGEMVIRNVTEYMSAEDVVLQAIRAIYNAEDECLGYVVIDISRSNFDALLYDHYDGNDSMVIMDEFWEEIYSSKSAKAEQIAQTLRARRMADEPINQDHDSMNYYIESIGQTGFYAVIGRQTLFTQEVTRQMVFIMFVVTSISLVLCLLIAQIMSNNLSSPIRNLSDGMKMAEEGKLDVTLESNRTDELGQLTHNFNRMISRLKNYMEIQVQQQQEINDANIAMMQAQLNPHFLYNTLDTMKWIAKANHITELATMASGLAKILRTSISEDKFIPLKEEIQLVESYMEIQRVRFHDRFSFDVEIPMELEDIMIPKLIIQPIVENAVIHGLSECEEGYIFLNIYEKEHTIYIEVSDDGQGMEPEIMERLNSRDREKLKGHLGFYNVDTILRLYYGDYYGLHAEQFSSGGTKITMILPHRE